MGETERGHGRLLERAASEGLAVGYLGGRRENPLGRCLSKSEVLEMGMG